MKTGNRILYFSIFPSQDPKTGNTENENKK